MREILFRGKRVDNGEWVYGYYFKGSCYFIKERPSSTFTSTFLVISSTVGQYTGLTDKNGNKIFEGDIFHLGDINIKHIVKWHDTGLMGKQAGASSYVGLSYWNERIEIIGNIHDNSELLEESICQ